MSLFINPSKNISSTEFEVDNWIISEFVVNHLVPIVKFHPFPLNELMLMTAATARFQPELIVEWGTNIGISARIFYEITKSFNIRSEIHTIDLPDNVFHNEHPKNRRGELIRGLKEVIMYQGDGLKYSLNIIKSRKPNGNILFFIDGDHSYDSVKKELKTILDNVPEAKVLLHDTFYQSEDSGYNIGPYKAIKEVLESKGDGVKLLSTNLGLPGMTLLY